MKYVLYLRQYSSPQGDDPQRLRFALPSAPNTDIDNVPGWGDGFLNKTLTSPDINHGVSGTSMPSYRAGGYWATVLSQVKTYKATHLVFVTIQFGHNDQKVAAYETAYSANLKQFVLDVDNAGGIPVRYPYPASPVQTAEI